MIYLYIFGSIALLIIFIVIMSYRHSEKKEKRFLKWISTWKVGDVVEIKRETSELYLCVEDNRKHFAADYYKKASDAYKAKNIGGAGAYVILKKWNDKDCLIEMVDGGTYHMSTRFIGSNITALTREIDKRMDNFATEKQKMRIKKLGRLLNK